jgi:hypothetical protein
MSQGTLDDEPASARSCPSVPWACCRRSVSYALSLVFRTFDRERCADVAQTSGFCDDTQLRIISPDDHQRAPWCRSFREQRAGRESISRLGGSVHARHGAVAEAYVK